MKNKRFLAAFAAVLVVAGCTLTLTQKQAVARQVGMAAAAAWVGTDKPTPEDITAMKDVVAQVQAAACTNCGDTATMYERAYPLVDAYITKNVKPEQQVIARLCASTLLTDISIAFAMNPSWSEKAGDASAIVEAFCEGAQAGLALSPSSPVMQAATRQVPVRVTAKRIR